MMEIGFLNIALIVVAWLVCGFGMYFIYDEGLSKANHVQTIALILAWPAVLFIFGLVILSIGIIYLGTWLGKGLKSVDYKIAFSNSFSVFKDRFFWGAVVGLIIGGIFVINDFNFWLIFLIWLVVFLVISFWPADKTAE